MKKWTIRILVIVFALFLLLLLVGCSSVDANEETTIGARYELFDVWRTVTGVNVYVKEDGKEFSELYHPADGEVVVVELPWELCHKGSMHVTIYYTDSSGGGHSIAYTFSVDDFEQVRVARGVTDSITTFRLRNVKG